MTRRAVCGILWAAILLQIGLPLSWADAAPVSEAGLEWQLLGRGVARVQTPAGIGTGFLISNSCLLTSARLMEGVQVDQVEIYFSDPLEDEPPVFGERCRLRHRIFGERLRLSWLRLMPVRVVRFCSCRPSRDCCRVRLTVFWGRGKTIRCRASRST